MMIWFFMWIFQLPPSPWEMCWAILYKPIQVPGFQVKAPLVQPPMLQGNKGKDAACNSLLIRRAWLYQPVTVYKRNCICLSCFLFFFLSFSIVLYFCCRTLDICICSSWNKTLVLIKKIVKCLEDTLNLSQFLQNSSKILADIWQESWVAIAYNFILFYIFLFSLLSDTLFTWSNIEKYSIFLI